LLNIDPDSLAQAKRLGSDLSFKNGLPSFRRIIALFEPLRNCSLDEFPLPRLNQLFQAVNGALTIFKQIKEFDLKQDQPFPARDSLITQARDNYDSWFDIVTPTISYAIRSGTDFAALERNARNVAEHLLVIEKQTKDQLETHLADSKEILEAIRGAAAETGVSQHAIHFKEEAERHKKASRWWLLATLFCALLTISFGCFVLLTFADTASGLPSHVSFQAGIAKLVLFSVLYYSIVWCGRTYKAHRHNYVVNKHRQNALGTFNAFVSATSDEDTKQTVLVESARCVFAPQVSGYLGRETASPSVSGQVLEILRKVPSGE
jgi:hypothetical protein